MIKLIITAHSYRINCLLNLFKQLKYNGIEKFLKCFVRYWHPKKGKEELLFCTGFESVANPILIGIKNLFA